ncbi:VOC family protein [Alteribacter natronophilus]|uniref:VOC family protein n=1 Tax=Alteribacter natronophilus TaxID=2583810 RepID=UPI001486F2F9|nr:VOC family protein [Alteribacter natronophilus]
MAVSPVLDGNRVNAHGRLIEWKMLTIEGDWHGLLYPFFIQWIEADHERLDLLKKEGVIKDHPAGKTTL